MPPENIWDDAEGLELHWKVVRQREADRHNGGSSFDDDDHDEPGSSDMLGNDLADVFKD